MKLTVLGKNGPWPAAGGACSGYLLEAGGVRLLLDCGCGVLGKLQRHCGINELDGIILTHLHSDHMGDVPVLRYALPFLMNRGMMKAPLPVCLPAEPAAVAVPILEDPNMAARAVAGGDSLRFAGLSVSFYAVRHPVPCNAVRIETDGKSFVYSGDLNTTPGFDGFSAGADLLLIDGCLTDAEWNENLPHLSAGLAAGVGKRASVRRLVLTHMRPGCDEAALLDEARRAYPAAETACEGGVYEI